MRAARCLLAGAFALGALAPAPAHAEPGMPSDIEWRLAELGAVIDPAETAKLYAPLQEKEPYQGIKVTRDLKYGPDERNTLDIFVAETPASAPRPVLVFVHGGGFVAGNKHAPGNFYYDNIMLMAARAGLVGINVTYRLAPQHKWPSGAQDVAAAVRWVSENVARHGGDAGRITLVGHSAGAVHVAGYVADARLHGPRGIALAGAVLISGLYDFARASSPAERAYFGEDARTLADAATIAGLAKAPIPLMVVHAELDPQPFIVQAQALADALCKAGRCPRSLLLAKHSHMSEVLALNTQDTALSEPLIAFAKGAK